MNFRDLKPITTMHLIVSLQDNEMRSLMYQTYQKSFNSIRSLYSYHSCLKNRKSMIFGTDPIKTFLAVISYKINGIINEGLRR